jgi:uncharacterized protein YprB with RNaseH-like and TPR domain
VTATIPADEQDRPPVTVSRRLFVLGDDALNIPASRITDALEYFDPDAVVYTAPMLSALVRSYAAPELGRDAVYPFTARSGGGTITWQTDVGPLSLVLAPSSHALLEHRPAADDRPIHVLTSDLELSVDRTILSTQLDGLEEWQRAVADAELDSKPHPRSYISTDIPAPYCHKWDGLQVYGVGPDTDGREPTARCLQLRCDGSVDVETVSWHRFGLQAVSGVGAKTAQRLRQDADITTRAELADVEPADLVDLETISRDRARKLTATAEAFRAGTIRLDGTGGADLPDGDPIYVDIETDGLTPSIVWLIGAYDSRRDEYHDFLERDPTNPAGAITAFGEWLSTRSRGQPIVAYNGRGFDFPHLRDHLEKYAPRCLDDWTGRYRWDPYEWQKDHATLPGRSNRLGDVSAALGYDGAGTGLSGAAVARKYTRWRDDERSATEPAWNVHRRYCEDDVRALAFVTEELLAAAADAPMTERESTGDNTSQSTLENY